MGKTRSLAKNARRYWLFKSEPDSFSIEDLAKEKKQTTYWDGVRNYQARNYLRDSIQLGDGVLFYHSSVEPMAIVGSAKVVKTSYHDFTAFDAANHHFDPKSDPDHPTWYMVDIQLLQIFPEPLTRPALQTCKELDQMVLLQRGSRLSIQPVTAAEWAAIHRLAGVKDHA